MPLQNSAVSEVKQRLSEGSDGFVTKSELALAVKPVSDATERFSKELSERKAAAFLSATNVGSEPKRYWSLTKTIYGSIYGFGRRARVDDAYEREVFQDLHEKALLAGSDSAGGFLVPEIFRDELIEQLKQRVAVRRALEADGGVPIPMASDTLKIPRGAGSVVASYTAENVDAALSDPTTEQVTISLKDLIAATQASNKLIELSSPEADLFISNRLIRAVREKEDITFLRADGSPAEEPTGILNLVDSGNKVNPSGGAGTDFDIDDLIGLEGILLDAGLDPPFQWIMNTKAWQKMRKLKDGNLRPLIEPDYSTVGFNRLPPLGYSVFIASQIPSNLGASSNETEIYLVKGSELLIGQSTNGAVVSASQHFKFLADATVIKVVLRHDIQLAHTKGLAVLTGSLAV